MSEKVHFTITFEVGQVLNKIASLVSQFVGGAALSTVKDLPRKPGESPDSHLDTSSELDLKPTTTTFNGLLCSACGAEQFETPSGATCINGHGGAEGVEPEDGDATLGQGNHDQTAGTDTGAGQQEPPPPPPPPAGVELDKDGLPWDHRIHVSTKTKKVTGQWKRKPKSDPVFVAEVEAELRQAMAVKGPDSPLGETDAEKVFGTGTGTGPATDQTAGAGQQPPPPPPPGGPNVAPIETFAQLMLAVTTAGLSVEVTTAACVQIGVASMPLLGARPDLVPAVAAILFPVAV